MHLKTIFSAAAFAAIGMNSSLANAADSAFVGTVCGPTACVPIPPPLALALIVAPAVIGNVKAAGNESGAGAQLLRVFGPSVKDIEKYGVWGGPNSFFRCPFGGC